MLAASTTVLAGEGQLNAGGPDQAEVSSALR
jgi:hypothetical protein